MAVKSRSLLGRYAPWAGKDLYRAEPAVTREGHGFFFGLKSTLYDKGYCGLILILPLEFLFTENYWSHDHKWEYSQVLIENLFTFWSSCKNQPKYFILCRNVHFLSICKLSKQCVSKVKFEICRIWFYT